MKILHFADLHIGVETHGRPDPTTGLSTRLHDFLTAFDELIDTAISEHVDLVLFAGDAYKSRDPSQTHQREFAVRIRRLVESGIAVYLLVGNHDVPNMLGKANALDIFETLGVPQVTVGRRVGTQVVQTRSGPVQVVGVPWPSTAQMLRREDLRGLPLADIDRRLEELIVEGIAREADALDPTLPAVLTAHVAMADSIVKTASEKFMTIGRFPQLLQSGLSPERFDYVALGHHHCYQVLRERPPVVYAGSLQRVDFGEEADPKGFILFELDPSRALGERVDFARVEFREVRARRFVTFDLRLRSDDPTAEVLKAIERVDVRDAIVRVRLSLNAEQDGRLDDRAVREALTGAHLVAAFTREIDRGVRRRMTAEVPPESLTPLEALAIYLEDRQTPADRKATLLEYARALTGGPGG
jgi:exonuclease SbcD